MNNQLTIACILDEFSYSCFEHECCLLQLDTASWKENMSHKKPDLLFVESAWNTAFKEFFRASAAGMEKGDEIIKWCMEHNIPTVFWGKDDPVHFHTFIDIAVKFDHIFTTDSGCINAYMEKAGHGHIYTMPFAAQPKIHNPVGRNALKLGKVAFAGTWYSLRPERINDMEMLLKPALHYGLHIYDRKYNYTLHDYYKFPDDYKSCIRGYLSPEQMYSAYKKYDIFLNVNTVKDSPTMFSRRIFELLACGTNVVSNYSQGLEKMFPGIVKLSKNKEDTAQHLEFLLGNEAERNKLSLKGLRNVLKEHTCTHRLNDILDKTGICRKTVENGNVSIITCTNKDGFINNVFKNYAAQNYKEKELIIILNGSSLNLEKWLEKAAFYKNIKVFRLDGEKTLGECLNFAVEKSGCQYIAKFDDDDYYAPEYLGDLVNCFKYTDADIAGKYSYYCYLKELRILAVRFPGLENLYSDFLSGATMVAKRKVFDRVRFKCLQKGTDTQFYRDCLVNGIRLYSSDRFNYVCVRGANPENHTWKIGHEEFLKKCSIASCTDRYEEYVTV